MRILGSFGVKEFFAVAKAVTIAIGLLQNWREKRLLKRKVMPTRRKSLSAWSSREQVTERRRLRTRLRRRQRP